MMCLAQGMFGGPVVCLGEPVASAVAAEVAPVAAASPLLTLPMVLGIGVILAVMEYQKEKGKVNDGISQETLPPADD